MSHPRSAEARFCVACGEQLHDGAALCHVCSSYQVSWKNSLRYWSGVVALFAAIAGVLLFAAERLPRVRSSLFGADRLSIVALSPHKAVLVNSGDRPVFASHIYLKAHAPADGSVLFSRLIYLDEVIEPRVFFRKERALATNTRGYAAGTAPADFDRTARLAARADDPCLVIHFFGRKDPRYRQIRQHGVDQGRPSVDELPVEASIHFFTVSEQEPRSASVAATALVAIKDECDVVGNMVLAPRDPEGAD